MDEIIARAIGYPYDRPDGSCIFEPTTGEVAGIDPPELDELCTGRTAVLAAGSNAAPRQLDRKFGGRPGCDEAIPVTLARVADLDVVYAARIARYGSVPATPADVTGSRAELHVTWLTGRQLDRMHDSEARGIAYDVEEMDPARVETMPPPLKVLRYQSVTGALHMAGSPIALGAIECSGRSLPARSQSWVLTRIACLFGLDLESLIRRVVSEPAFRMEVSSRLNGLDLLA